MSWTDQKPYTVTQEHLKLNWGGVGRKNFRCGFCGHKFKKGDIARWVFTNHTKAGGNPFICFDCDEPDNPAKAVEAWKEKHKVFESFLKSDEWWWFKYYYIDIPKKNARYGMG